MALVGLGAMKRVAEKLVDDIYSLLKRHLKNYVRGRTVKQTAALMAKGLRNVRNVKTIWQVEKKVDLTKFFCPPRVDIYGTRRQIRDLDDFWHKGNMVLRGTVGQGKSILFRYLASREFMKGDRVPLFVELRRLAKGQSLQGHLISEMRALGLDVDVKAFRILAKHGKILCFLDGFDEVKEAQRSRVVTEIERLAREFDAMRIHVASRPNSGIESSPQFQVFDLTPLQGKEYEEAVACMAGTPDLAANVVNGVKKAGGKVRQVLTTPLMVALLVFRFRAEQSIPETTVAFYDDLFQVLLSRHDKSKPGYRRHRKSRLGDNAIEEIFNALCFLTRKTEQGVFTNRELFKHIRRAVQVCGHSVSADDFLADIVEITCLILQEAGECTFIHKSIQEYHCARFIAESPDEMARKFYERSRSQWRRWSQELDFLHWIDKYRFLKWFVIPDGLELLALTEEQLEEEHSFEELEHIHLVFGDAEVRVHPSLNKVQPSYPAATSWTLLHDLAVRPFNEWMVVGDAFSWDEIIKKAKAEHPDLPWTTATTHPVSLGTVSGLLDSGFTSKQLAATANSILCSIQKRVLEASREVKRIEKTVDLFEL
jgi:hypothetical protein